MEGRFVHECIKFYFQQEFWGPRKTWVKETPLPANLEEQPTVWVMFAI